jgi:hypothetical protein
MSENQLNGAPPARQSSLRLTIGFISCFLTGRNSYSIWQRVMGAVRERGVNLLSFLAT